MVDFGREGYQSFERISEDGQWFLKFSFPFKVSGVNVRPGDRITVWYKTKNWTNKGRLCLMKLSIGSAES